MHVPTACWLKNSSMYHFTVTEYSFTKAPKWSVLAPHQLNEALAVVTLMNFWLHPFSSLKFCFVMLQS